jgi:hypothetical protein
MTKLFVLCFLLTLSGCEVCREHRNACAIALGVAVTCVALSGGKHEKNSKGIVIVCPAKGCR